MKYLFYLPLYAFIIIYFTGCGEVKTTSGSSSQGIIQQCVFDADCPFNYKCVEQIINYDNTQTTRHVCLCVFEQSSLCEVK
jgi:hypothetical protein